MPLPPRRRASGGAKDSSGQGRPSTGLTTAIGQQRLDLRRRLPWELLLDATNQIGFLAFGVAQILFAQLREPPLQSPLDHVPIAWQLEFDDLFHSSKRAHSA